MTVPLPRELRTVISPFSCSTRLLTMGIPRPVPEILAGAKVVFPGKRFEDLSEKFTGHAAAGIADDDLVFAGKVSAADLGQFDLDIVAFTAVLKCIGKQIFQDLTHAQRIAVYDRGVPVW